MPLVGGVLKQGSLHCSAGKFTPFIQLGIEIKKIRYSIKINSLVVLYLRLAGLAPVEIQYGTAASCALRRSHKKNFWRKI